MGNQLNAFCTSCHSDAAVATDHQAENCERTSTRKQAESPLMQLPSPELQHEPERKPVSITLRLQDLLEKAKDPRFAAQSAKQPRNLVEEVKERNAKLRAAAPAGVSSLDSTNLFVN